MATKGYAAPEVGETYTRARQLCQSLDDPRQLFPVLRGLWRYYVMRAELQTAHALSEQLLDVAQQAQVIILEPYLAKVVGDLESERVVFESASAQRREPKIVDI